MQIKEQTKTEIALQVLQQIEEHRAYIKVKISEWAATLEVNPVNAMAGSLGTFEYAAQLEVYTRTVNCLKVGLDPERVQTLDEMIAHILGIALENVFQFRAGNRSTSASSNLMDDYKTAAWMEVLNEDRYGPSLGRPLKKILEAEED